MSWADELGAFHDRHSGITEDLLCMARDAREADPYDWVAEALDVDGLVADVGCGSGALAPHVDDWVGCDPSGGELRRARSHGRGPLVQARGEALPLAPGALGAASMTMALMVVQRPGAALDEVARTVRAGGQLVVLLPADGPLTRRDRVHYAMLLAVLVRKALPFPHPDVIESPRGWIHDAGFAVEHEECRRFSLPLTSHHEADRFVESLYLPGVGSLRRRLARRLVRTWVGGVIGIPLRLVVARRTPSPQQEPGPGQPSDSM